MMLLPGDKILIAHRGLFAADDPRFFVGAVDSYEDGMVRFTGSSFVRDRASGRIQAKEEPATKIVPLASGCFIAYVLPQAADLSSVRLEHEGDRLTAADGGSFSMNLSEYLRNS
ncbi:MAG: hypothetical protein U0744_02960 [Gemmataceae bacterium]